MNLHFWFDLMFLHFAFPIQGVSHGTSFSSYSFAPGIFPRKNIKVDILGAHIHAHPLITDIKTTLSDLNSNGKKDILYIRSIIYRERPIRRLPGNLQPSSSAAPRKSARRRIE